MNNKGHQDHLQSQAAPAVYYVPANQAMDDDEINLLDYWRVLVERKYFIAGITFVSTVIAIVAALLMTEIYRAEATLAPVTEDPAGAMGGLMNQFGGLASLAGINLGASSGGKMEEALAVLQSRQFLGQFIKDNQILPVLFAEQWDSQNKKWLVENEADIPTDWDAFKAYITMLEVESDVKTGMIKLAIEWEDPVLASIWVNQLVQRLNQHQKRLAIEEAQKSIKYLEEQLGKTGVVEMRQAMFNLIEAQTKNIMLANVRDEYVFKVIDPAVVPEERIKPKRKLMVVLGFMVGLMLAVFLAFFLNFIQNQKSLGTLGTKE